MKTEQDYLDFLQETVDYYSEDVSRRATKNSKCLYKTGDGRMCAVGRCLDPEKYELWMEGNSVELSPEIEEALKPQYRGFDVSFLQHVQDLHDKNINWGENGLTYEGEEAVKSIRENIKMHDYEGCL